MVAKRSLGDIVFDTVNIVFLTLLVVATLYPCLYVLLASLSEPAEVARAQGLLFIPKKLQLGSYALAFDNPNIISGYINTIVYVGLGTALNLLMTLMGAYGLSRKYLYGRNLFMFVIVFTMFFSGGLIPMYLTYKSLGFYDNMAAMIVPYAINAFYLIILRTFFQTIPDSLEESAKIDGANDFTILFRIMVPLALPAMAVVTLYYAVDNWNTYLRGVIFLQDRDLYPIQVILREILIQNVTSSQNGDITSEVAENVKYATIVIATLPILCVYPFLQRYFVKGVMIGAVKG